MQHQVDTLVLRDRPGGSGGGNNFFIGEDFSLRPVESTRCPVGTSGVLAKSPRGR
jgi:hypothetical protein